MLVKEQLKEEFSKDWKKHYKVALFKEKGFDRRTCKNCGKNFWTLDEKRTVCPDPPCENYGFIGRKTKNWDYIKTWKEFEAFFKKNGHHVIRRYPTICRWRDDLYFTAASIVNFQRWDKGKITFEYPEDVLIVPQPILRFNDIPNVGVTGRHFSGFVMPGQHAFGRKDYWKDRTIDLNFNFITKVMGVPKKELTYVEDVWTMPDQSAFGPALESFSRGLELATSVFMQYSKTGKRVEELETKVIDVGWGLERLAWFVSGSPTAYDATFGPVLDKMRKKSSFGMDKNLFTKYTQLSGALNFEEVHNLKGMRESIAKELGVSLDYLNEKLAPQQALYSIADHSRTLLFAIADSGIPSNVGGGYNLRVVLRRALGFINEFEMPFKLEDVASWNADYLKPLFPELKERMNEVEEIIQFEDKKYRATLERARNKIHAMVEKNPKFGYEDLTRLYESDGITPELITDVAKALKKKVEIPDDFYAHMTEKHSRTKHVEEKTDDTYLKGLKKTKILYYDLPYGYEFDAKVLKQFEKNGHHYAVLDQTMFFPLCGGQYWDTGNLDGVKVTEVQDEGGIIVHKLDRKLKEKKIHGLIDKARRLQISQHHTATHIVNGAATHVLGRHVWQIGAEKTTEKGRLDITHYDLLTDEQLDKIERAANKIVREKRPIRILNMPRDKAEKKYGFRIYQGGVAPSPTVRIIDIKDWDVECCGGTHFLNTKDVEAIKITRVEKKQDGVIRLEYVAGPRTVAELKKKSEIIKRTAEALNTDEDKLIQTANRMAREWKELRKELEKMKNIVAEGTSITSEEPVQYVPDIDMKTMQGVARKYVSKNPKSFMILITDGSVLGIKGSKCKTKVEVAVSAAAKIMGGKAGGRGNEWKGGGPKKNKSKAAFEKVKKMV
jgi:alanyl-tRNA synthetase